jgi:hypothetical protein
MAVASGILAAARDIASMTARYAYDTGSNTGTSNSSIGKGRRVGNNSSDNLNIGSANTSNSTAITTITNLNRREDDAAFAAWRERFMQLLQVSELVLITFAFLRMNRWCTGS